MTDLNQPQLKPFERHIFVCTGDKCAPETSSALYEHLKQRLREVGKHEGPKRIARSKSSCLGICKGGPLAVVYPENVWYKELTEEKLEEVIQNHLIAGKPCENYRLLSDPS